MNQQGTRRRIWIPLVIHLLGLLSMCAYGAWRHEQYLTLRTLPTPDRVPVVISPRHSRPDLVDVTRLKRMLERLRPDFVLESQPSINHIDHALRLWGTDVAFSTESQVYTGADLRALLLDHRSFALAWGAEARPLLIPDTRAGDVQFRTQQGPGSASHVDHTLAGLAEVGTPLDFPVLSPSGEYPLEAALTASLKSFSLNQEEYEWSTLVFLHYLSNERDWYTSEGQRISWDRLADRLMRQRWNQGVCFGQHRLYVLAALLCRDDESPHLSAEGRARVVDHLEHVTERLVAAQHADGYWSGDWPGSLPDGSGHHTAGPLGPVADRLLVTGHVLEWWAYAPDAALPDEDVVQLAVDWLFNEFESLSDRDVRRFYPFLTHVALGLSLWAGKSPAEIYQGHDAPQADTEFRNPD